MYKHFLYLTYLLIVFFFIAKLLVVIAKNTISETRELLEIIDLIDPTIENDELFVDGKMPIFLDGTHGCILQNQLLLCGSNNFNPNERKISYSKDCTIVSPNYKKLYQMLKLRIDASSVKISEDSLWILGGLSTYRTSTNCPMIVEKSTEIVSLNRPPIEGKSLPFAIYGHSMVAVDQHTIYLIGGTLDNDSGNPTNQCWIIDPTNNFDLKPGPSLQVARSEHSSSKIKINRKIYLVVAGGDNGNSSLDSVELLDTTSPHQGWISGNYEPIFLCN